MKIILLGTGDPLNDERAQTSLAVPLDGGETLLVDTSSGVVLLGQLRAAGLTRASIRHVVISHRHFDHAGGLAPLLLALVSLPQARVTVYAAPETLEALHAMLALTIPGLEEWLGARLDWRALTSGEAVALGSAVVTPFEVDHGLECVGLRIAQGGKAVVFSADTQPCPSIVPFARESDLLIHEAYGLQSTAAAAHLFGHSTAAEAGTAAREAGVPRLLLTHLRSSRAVDAPVLAAEASVAYGRPVELAHDLDVIEV